MSTLFTEAKLNSLEQGDLDALVEFDEHGLILGPEEAPADLAKRVRVLTGNIAEVRQEIAKNGATDFFFTKLQKQDEIPPKIFAAAREKTRELYGFAIDWVPGFFTNYRMGLLHAGCAFYSYDDFFALFILRKAFQHREKWLIYSRTELMAHELCHIAHLSFRSLNYEEIFAYQTAESWFRRGIGGLLRTPKDTYLILGSVLFLLAAQMINIFTRPPELWRTTPMPQIFGLVGCVVFYVVGRYLWFWRRYRRALRRIALVVGESRSPAVLFRCADEEITQLAALKTRDDVAAWLERKQADDIRWQLIMRRFGRE